MKIYNLYSGVNFGLSSFVQQNTKVQDIKEDNIKELCLKEINGLKKQPTEDEFIKEAEENQKRYEKQLEEKNKKFKELINKPQKFSIEV